MTRKRVFQQSTDLNSIRIERSGQQHHLKFDSDLDAIQSAINLEQPHQLIMQNLQYLMGILLFIQAPKKILLLGVGGGSLVHFFAHYLPDSEVTGVEYNAQLINIAQQQLGLPQASAQLRYIIEDARDFVQQTDEQFDLVVIDIFEGRRSPQWLLEKTFNLQLKRCLSAQGAVAYNLLINSETKFSRFYELMRQLYQQQTLCMETEDYENILVYGLNKKSRPRSMEKLLERCEQLSGEFELPFAQILSTIYNINPIGSGII